MGTSFEDVS